MPERRYTIKRDDDGSWSVRDLSTELPVTIRERVLSCLEHHEAQDAISLLSMIERMKGGTTKPAAGPGHLCENAYSEQH